MDADDCIYPDCQIKGEWLGTACEHSCPFEEMRKEIERRERKPAPVTTSKGGR